jgi:Leucine-rich repeat (LRR) protein
LVLTLTATAGAVAWNQYEPTRIRDRLQEIGLSSFTKEGRLIINTNPAFTSESLAKAGPFLEKLASHITEVDLVGQVEKVTNIAPLKALTRLRDLNLWHTQIADIEPLKNLTELQYLALSSPWVTDIEPLKNLTQLQALKLIGARVANTEPLKALRATTIYWEIPPQPPAPPAPHSRR